MAAFCYPAIFASSSSIFFISASASFTSSAMRSSFLLWAWNFSRYPWSVSRGVIFFELFLALHAQFVEPLLDIYQDLQEVVLEYGVLDMEVKIYFEKSYQDSDLRHQNFQIQSLGNFQKTWNFRQNLWTFYNHHNYQKISQMFFPDRWYYGRSILFLET